MELGGESKHQNEDSLRNCAEFRWPVRYRGRLGRLFQSLERPEMSIARAVGLAVTSLPRGPQAVRDGDGENRIARRVF